MVSVGGGDGSWETLNQFPLWASLDGSAQVLKIVVPHGTDSAQVLKIVVPHGTDSAQVLKIVVPHGTDSAQVLKIVVPDIYSQLLIHSGKY